MEENILEDAGDFRHLSDLVGTMSINRAELSVVPANLY